MRVDVIQWLCGKWAAVKEPANLHWHWHGQWWGTTPLPHCYHLPVARPIVLRYCATPIRSHN